VGTRRLSKPFTGAPTARKGTRGISVGTANNARGCPKLSVTDGTDQAQAPDQAPRQRRRHRRGPRAQARTPKPPTWKGALKKAGLATGFIFVFLLITNKFRVLPALVFAILAMLLYIPSGYYLDGYLYRRYQRKQLQQQ
jgi:hypothetical protein